MTRNQPAIIGAGTMGSGIAIGCLAAGLPTTVVDMTERALAALRGKVEEHFNRQVEKERMTSTQAADAIAHLTTSTDFSTAAEADLVIEAVFEDISVKKEVFARLNAYLSPDALLATNTSALRVTDLAVAVEGPERFLGLHYFSPAEINPLVEVISGPCTAPEAIERALRFLEITGKTALRCRDTNGFAVNRFFCPYTNEAARLLDEGFGSSAQIDAVARQLFDLPLGPFAVMNIIKPSINLNAIRNLGALGTFYAPAGSMVATGEAHRKWQIEEDASPLPDEAQVAVADRLRAAVFLPVLEALNEDVAAPEAFDTGARLALRFGSPPVALMRKIWRDQVIALLKP